MSLLVSIIIPTFNSEKTLKLTLESISRQTYNNVEVIIVDSGSTDRTLEIASKYASKIISIDSKSRSIARYIGISSSKGDVIFLLDSDQVIPRDFIETVVQKVLLNNCDIIATPTLILGHSLHSKGDLYRYFLHCIHVKKIMPDFPRIFNARIKEILLELYPLVEYCEDRILLAKLSNHSLWKSIKYCILPKPIFELRTSGFPYNLIDKIRKAVYYGKWYSEIRKTMSYISIKIRDELYDYAERSIHECIFINQNELENLIRMLKISKTTIKSSILVSCVYQLLSTIAFLISLISR